MTVGVALMAGAIDLTLNSATSRRANGHRTFGAIIHYQILTRSSTGE